MTERISGFIGNRWLILTFALMSLSFFIPYEQNAFADTVISTIPVGNSPYGIAINPNTNLVYVANNGANTISVIDGTNDSILSTINELPDHPDTIAVNPTTNKIYVTTSSDILIIDGSTNSIIGNIVLGHHAYSVIVNPETNKIYAVNTSTIEVIDGSTNTVIASLPQRYISANELAVNPTTNLVYATHSMSCYDCNYVSTIDGTTDTQINSLWVYCGGGIAVNSITNKIYVSQHCPNTVAVIDGSTNSIESGIQVDNGPGGIDVNPNSNKVYVANYWSDNVSVIDGVTNTVIDTIAVGMTPMDVVVNPVTNKVYISNLHDNTVSVIKDTSIQDTSQITINSQDSNGNAITGFYTELYQNENEIATDYTPANFTLNNNECYTVHVEDYGDYVFDHWSDTGSTDASRDILASSNIQITAVYKTIPQPPEDLTATGKILKIDLRWNTPTDDGGSPITGYKIERSTNSGNTWSTIVANTGNDAITYSDTKVLPLTSYTYRVSTINDVGISSPSNNASATTPSAGPIIVPRIL